MDNLVAVIVVSLLSGLVGVGVTLLVQKRAIKIAEKENIFKVLMSNRFIPGPSYEKTRVLNSIDIAFYKSTSVIAAWKSLYECYSSQHPNGIDANDKMIKLLQTMGDDLGYKKLDWTTIKNSYFPVGVSDFLNDESEYRKIQLDLIRKIQKVANNFFDQFDQFDQNGGNPS